MLFNQRCQRPLLSRRKLLKRCARRCWRRAGFLAVIPVRWQTMCGLGRQRPRPLLVTLDGRKISTADLLGNVVILTFWATWCAPCREELPVLSNYGAQHAEAGLRVLVSVWTPPISSTMRGGSRKLCAFLQASLANSSAPGYGRIWRLPVNFTIDRAGRLVEDGWKVKKPAWTPERLEQIVTPVLTSASQ